MPNNGAIDRNIVSTSPQVNPAIPDSIGALLAEEWTINPASTLPSFLERMMMEEARRSGWQTLQSLFSIIEQQLSRVSVEDREQRISQVLVEDERRDSNNNTESGSGVEGIRRLYDALFRRWPRRVAKAFLEKIFRPFGPEIRFLILYVLERTSLVYSKATISESLYGGTRVKLGEPSLSDQNERRRSLRPIEKHDTIRLAFLMAFGPYLEERSEFLFQCLLRLCSFYSTDGISVTTTRTSIKNKLQIILKVVWPLLRTTTKGAFLWYRWRYLLGKTVFFDPYSSWLDLVVRRVTSEDQQQQQSKPETGKGDSTNGLDPNNIRFEYIRKNLSKLMKSNGLRLAAGGLVSSCTALAWIARIRSIRQGRQQERELHELRQMQLRQLQQPNEDVNVSDVDSNDMMFTRNACKKMIPPPPRSAPFCRSNSKISAKKHEKNSR